MSRQSEIREGIVNIIDDTIKLTPWETANQIISYLHSKGVVIKKESICSKCINGFTDSVPNGSSTVCPSCHGNYKRILIESLIKEE